MQQDEDIEVLASRLEFKAKKLKEENEKILKKIVTERQKLEEEKIKMNFVIKEDIIELDVGGEHFRTHKNVLCKYSESFLAGIFTGKCPHQKDVNGIYFIDGDGKAFRYILHFLRRGEMAWPADPGERKILLDEITFYKLNKFVSAPPDLPVTDDGRFLGVVSKALSKLNEIDGELQLSNKLGTTAINGIKKAIEIDEAYEIHRKVGSSLATVATAAYKFDNDYEIHQKLSKAIVTGCTKALELNEQYQIHDKVSNLVQTGITTAQVVNDRYSLNEKLSSAITKSYQTVCNIDRRYKIQERAGGIMYQGIKYIFVPKDKKQLNESGQEEDEEVAFNEITAGEKLTSTQTEFITPTPNPINLPTQTPTPTPNNFVNQTPTPTPNILETQTPLPTLSNPQQITTPNLEQPLPLPLRYIPFFFRLR